MGSALRQCHCPQLVGLRGIPHMPTCSDHIISLPSSHPKTYSGSDVNISDEYLPRRFSDHFSTWTWVSRGTIRMSQFWTSLELRWCWQLELQVVQSSSQIVTIIKPTPIFYGPYALPVAQPAVPMQALEWIHFGHHIYIYTHSESRFLPARKRGI